MTTWFGANWQLITSEDPYVTAGVTFGIGLLDEPIAQAGALGIAVSALRAELSRALELRPGDPAVPEVVAEVNTDTVTIALRGHPETVAAAWLRLPGLFTGQIVAGDARAYPLEPVLWSPDMLVRSGTSAATIAWLPGLMADDAHALARAVLPRLDPLAGDIPAVFFTNAASLVGTAFPVRDELAPRRRAWADGTAFPPEQLTGTGCGALAIPCADGGMLLSFQVPRTAQGKAAAIVAIRQLNAMATQTHGEQAQVAGDLAGLGPDLCVVARCAAALPEPARRELLTTFTAAFPLVPDVWLEQADADAHERAWPVREREQRLFGVPAFPAGDLQPVRQALARARTSMHVAVGVPPVPGGERPRPGRQLFGADPEPVAGFPLEKPGAVIGKLRRFRAWSRNAGDGRTMAHQLVISDQAIMALMGPRQVPGQNDGPRRWRAVDASQLLLVARDQDGETNLVDRSMYCVIRFYPEQFWGTARLRRQLQARLAGVPAFTRAHGTSPAKVKRWERRGKTARVLAFAIPAILLAAFALSTALGALLGQHAITGRVQLGETATLANGTTITARGFDIAYPTPGQPGTKVTVTVQFCAGGNTRIDGQPPEAQRSVAPQDFALYGAGGAERLIDSPGQLRPVTLQEGQCTSGTLAYEGANLDPTRFAYSNAAGDDVVWYRQETASQAARSPRHPGFVPTWNASVVKRSS